MAGRRGFAGFVAGSAVAGRRRGRLTAPGLSIACAFGRSGIGEVKREGDGKTPAGRLHMVNLLYRADRLRRPATGLPARPIRHDDGWCDDAGHLLYNQPVRLPFAGSHERLWREDRLYDIVVVLDHNLVRPKRVAGSAIFLHIASPGYAPTAGCIAVSEPDMRRLLKRWHPGMPIDIR